MPLCGIILNLIRGETPMSMLTEDFMSISYPICLQIIDLFLFVMRLFMKEMLYEVRCLKSNEDMILALAGQFKQLSHKPEKFR